MGLVRSFATEGQRLVHDFQAGERELSHAGWRTTFFGPRGLSPWLSPEGSLGALGFYDTAELRRTLERLVDFDRVNAGEVRLSVGAVDVRTGNFVYFDTTTHTIGPEHIIASRALPPGFPPIEKVVPVGRP